MCAVRWRVAYTPCGGEEDGDFVCSVARQSVTRDVGHAQACIPGQCSPSLGVGSMGKTAAVSPVASARESNRTCSSARRPRQEPGTRVPSLAAVCRRAHSGVGPRARRGRMHQPWSGYRKHRVSGSMAVEQNSVTLRGQITCLAMASD